MAYYPRAMDNVLLKNKFRSHYYGYYCRITSKTKKELSVSVEL